MSDFVEVNTILGFTVTVPKLLHYTNQREKEIAVTLQERQIREEIRAKVYGRKKRAKRPLMEAQTFNYENIGG